MEHSKYFLGGKDTEHTWDMDGFYVALNDEPRKYMVALLSPFHNIDWDIHMENKSGSPMTSEEKDILFKALTDNMVSGDVVTSHGGCTPGGISGIKNLANYGFKVIGTNSGKDVYWASFNLLDMDKFNKWIQHAPKEDYIVIDETKPLTLDNVRPVLKIMQKK